MTKTLLLVDDDKDVHQYIRLIAEKSGYRFCSAFNGVEGLKTLVTKQPDLLILDLMMPVKSGIEMYYEIKEAPKYESYADIPIIMLTALEQSPSEIKKLLKLGLCAYLEKPFRAKELINVIQNAFLLNEINVKNAALRKATEKSKNFLENLIASCPLAIITTDRKGHINFISRSLETIIGKRAKGMVGLPVHTFLGMSQADFTNIRNEIDFSNPLVIKEISVRSDNADHIPLKMTFSYLRDRSDHPKGLLAVAEDLSQQKQLEREKLEKERLQAITESLATINHQINNPLTPILGNLQLIKKNERSLPESLKKKIEIIEKNAKRIFDIVQEFNCVNSPTRQKYYGNTSMLNI